jgi:hypothetical protein
VFQHDEGMVNLDEVEYLTPKDVEQIIMYVTRPGGTTDVKLPEIPQVFQVGDADFVVTFPGHTHHISNRGHPVLLRAVMNIKLLVFWLNRQGCISHIPDMAAITVPTLRVWHKHMTFEGGHTVTATQPVMTRIGQRPWSTCLNTLWLTSESKATHPPRLFTLRKP